MKNRELSRPDKIIHKTAQSLIKLSNFVYDNRGKVLSAFITLTILLSIGLKDFSIDQSMEGFFKEDNKTIKTYQWFKYVYGSDEFVIVMYTPKNGDIFSQESLTQLKSLEEQLNKGKNDPESPLSRIKRIRSIISADYLENKNDTLINRPFIGKKLPQSDSEREILRKLALAHKDYPKTFLSQDSRFGVIMIETDYGTRVMQSENQPPVVDKKQADIEEDDFDFGEDGDETIAKLIKIEDTPTLERVPMDGYSLFISELKKVFNSQQWQESHKTYFAGNPWLMDFFMRVIMAEMEIYGTLSFVIIWIVMVVTFRSFSALVWPTVILATGSLWCLGLTGWTQTEMTFMVQVIVFLLLAVSIAASIHILSAYSRHILTETSKKEAIAKTYGEVGVPVILAAITTALGLISLIFVPILAIQNFGLFASIGVLFTLLINLVMWPVFMRLYSPKLNPKKKKKDSMMTRFLSTNLERVLDRKKTIIGIFAAVAILGIMGLPKIVIDTNLVKMIKGGYGITESYHVIDQYFGGTTSIEILVDTGVNDGVKSHLLLKAVEEYENEVMSKYDQLVHRSRSLVNVTKDSYKNIMDGTQKYDTIPDSDEKVAQVLASFESADPTTRKMIVDDSWQIARITFSTISTGSHIYEKFLNDIDKIAYKHFAPFMEKNPEFNISYTGGMVLMTDMISLVAVSMIQSFSLALVVICLVLFLVFGSFKFGLISMIPNIFPVVTAMGVAGWLGIPMDADTLLVLPLAIGIAVDDTIHFLTHYKTELINGRSNQQAIQSSLTHVGRAMISTTIVLSLGFLIFVMSSYIPLGNFGILASLAMVSALIADLFLLPVLLEIFRPFEKKDPLKIPTAASVAIALLAVLFSGAAIGKDKGTDIAQKMIDRDDGYSFYTKSLLLSCQFKESATGKRKCSSGKRKKLFEGVGMDMDPKGNVTKALNIIEEPAGEKGMAFLQEDYKESGKDSQQWMYMPALKKLKRIVAADSSGPKTGTLFGSEIAYEDIERIHLSDYTYKLLGEEKINKLDTWILELTPTARRRAKSSYSRSVMWIDKESFISVKGESYDKQNKLAKTYLARDIRKVNGIWFSHQQIVINHKTSRMTLLKVLKAKINIKLTKEIVSSRILDDKDFRNSQLKMLRD